MFEYLRFMKTAVFATVEEYGGKIFVVIQMSDLRSWALEFDL